MARKKDAEEDMASKAILDQLQTKTVGAPPSTTGLTGDQLPETIFDVADFDTVKNQVTLQLSNLELLNVLNTVGQVTNTQSQSGPIPDTSFNKQVTVTGSGEGNGQVVFTPNHGEVFAVNGISFQESLSSGNAVMYVGLRDSNSVTTYFLINTTGGSPWSPDADFNKMVYLDSKMTLFVYAFGTFGTSETVICNFNLIRVR